jgi:hypothetical protein
LKQFRCCVRRAPAEGVELVSRDELVAEAKVRDLDVHFAVEKQVLGLQVAMDNLLLVAVLDRRYNLKKETVEQYSLAISLLEWARPRHSKERQKRDKPDRDRRRRRRQIHSWKERIVYGDFFLSLPV